MKADAATLRAAAEALVAQGARIFPLQPGTKEPYLGTRGFLDARADASPWGGDVPHNIGLVPASLGLVAVDVDQPEHWDAARRWGLLAQPTFEVETPKPGRHFYFRAPAPASGAGLDGLIVRAAHGYTVAPPSVLPNGAYVAHGTFADALPLPPAFATALYSASSSSGRRDRVFRVFTAPRIAAGNRHEALCTLAGHLAAHQIDEAFALGLVHAWNAQYCDPPKDAREVTRLVGDIYAKERATMQQNAAALLASARTPQPTRLAVAPERTVGGRRLFAGRSLEQVRRAMVRRR